jgi:hypothetical protein
MTSAYRGHVHDLIVDSASSTRKPQATAQHHGATPVGQRPRGHVDPDEGAALAALALAALPAWAPSPAVAAVDRRAGVAQPTTTAASQAARIGITA